MLLRSFIAIIIALSAIALAGCAPHRSPQNTMTITAPASYTEHSYRGTPDLGLTLAMVQAGGGPQHFDSLRLFRVMAGSRAQRESASLDRMYGKAKMAAFMQTFNYAVKDLLTIFAINHIALPDRPRISPHDGVRIAEAIYRDGIMPGGKYDCGYMMEHLMKHPVHIVLMHDINNARGHGPRHNANFHIILTQMIADLVSARGTRPKTARTSGGYNRRHAG